MRGLWIEAGEVRLRDDLPAPQESMSETRVRVSLAGVCATDLALARGYMGFRGVPGHEFVGVALDGALAGKRVVGEINAGCGQCELCLAGDPRHCRTRGVLGILGLPGAFAEELRLPTQNLLVVPDHVPDQHAVFCEPLAAAVAVCELLADGGRGARTLVVGDGRLGLLCALALARAGAEVTLAGRHPERQALLPKNVRHVLGVLEPGSPRGQGEFDVAVDASGQPEVLGALLSHVRPRGTLVLKTTAERSVALDLAPLVVDEIKLVGSRCGRFAPALDWLAHDPPPLEGLLDSTFALGSGTLAFDRAAQRGSLKVLLDPTLPDTSPRPLDPSQASHSA